MEQNLAKHPLVIAAIGGLLTLGGGWLQDRLSTETREASNAVRIATLEEKTRTTVNREDLARIEQQLKDSQRAYVTREEFQQFSSAMLRSADETRAELRALAVELRGRR